MAEEQTDYSTETAGALEYLARFRGDEQARAELTNRTGTTEASTSTPADAGQRGTGLDAGAAEYAARFGTPSAS